MSFTKEKRVMLAGSALLIRGRIRLWGSHVKYRKVSQTLVADDRKFTNNSPKALDLFASPSLSFLSVFFCFSGSSVQPSFSCSLRFLSPPGCQPAPVASSTKGVEKHDANEEGTPHTA